MSGTLRSSPSTLIPSTVSSFDDVPAWLEERIEVGDMLEEAGCELAGWPLDPAEQDPLVPLRPLVVAGGLTVAVNGIVRIQAGVRG